MNKKNRIILLAAMIVAAVSQTFAQGNGLAGINEATSMVTSYFDPGTKLIYAIGAVVGLIGGIKVYGKFSSGDPDTSKTAASWFGAWAASRRGGWTQDDCVPFPDRTPAAAPSPCPASLFPRGNAWGAEIRSQKNYSGIPFDCACLPIRF